MHPHRRHALSRALFTSAIVLASLIAPHAATAATQAPASRAVSAATASPAAASLTVAQMTAAVFAQTNQVRYNADRNGLVRNAALDKVAAAWAYQQWKNGAMSHNPSYWKQIPSGWTRAGENVAKGYTYTQVVGAWAASPSHYANLVNDYTSIGIGFYEADGKRYWSQVFAKYPGTKVPARTTSATTASAAYPAEPAAPAGTRITLSAPSFEKSTAGWTTSGGTITGPTTASRGGQYFFATTGGIVSQTLTMTPVAGTRYIATIWVSPGSTARSSGTLNLTALGGTAETAKISFSVSSGWMKVSVPLTVLRSGHSGIRIDVILPKGGSYRIDSVSLVRTAT
jgi:uncharacterized protein YkwD